MRWRGRMEGTMLGNIRARRVQQKTTAAAAAQRRRVWVIAGSGRCWRHELRIGVAGDETGVVDALAWGRSDDGDLCVGIDAIEGGPLVEEEGVGV